MLRPKSRLSRRTLLLANAGLATMAWSAPLLAQAAPSQVAPPAPEAPSPGGQTDASPLQDIVVTARRRTERLQDVPIAVSAVSGATLQQANITQVADIQQKVPGMTITPSAFGSNILQVAIRGQRQYDPYITKDPAVAVYFADVVQNRPQGLNSALFDIDSVQVLKGPQGTLFGRNTTGGAVIISPVTPKNQFQGYVTAAYGNYDAKRLEGAINVPITDTLAVRAAGALTRRDGFTKDLTTGQRLDDDHKDNWRLSVRFTPSDRFENRLVLNGFRADENGTAYKFYAYRQGTPTATFINAVDPGGLDRELARLASLPFHTTLSDDVLKTDIKTFAASNVTEWRIGTATLKNIAGYRYVKSSTNFDLEGSSYNFYHSREDMQERQYSDELQLLGKAFNESVDYIVGAFYFHERGYDRQLSNTFVTYAPLHADRYSIGDPITNVSYSFFGQATYRLSFLQGVSITGGVRQNYDERTLVARSLTNGVCRLVTADVGGVILSPCEKKVSKDFHKLTYTASIDWKVTHDVLLYIAHRQGYRTGGFNLGGGRPSELAPFEPESVRDFEAGLKSSFTVAGVRSRLNVAAYTQDYKNIQRSIGYFVPGTTPPAYVNGIQNAAAARINGVEADLALVPVRDVEVGGNVSYIHAKYKSFFDRATGLDLTKSAFAGTPKWSYSAYASWSLPLANRAGKIVLRGDVYHETKSDYADANFDPVIQAPAVSSIIPAFTIVNARVEWQDVLNRPVSLAFFAKNLFNEKYIAGGTDITLNVGYAGVILGAPRTYGVEARYRF